MKYIGQTINEKRRKRNHVADAIIRNSQSLFHTALREYGIDGFDYQILEDCNSDKRSFLSEREEYWITNLDTVHPKGYNAYVKSCVLSLEIREKIRRTMTGNTNGRGHHKISPESKEKMRSASLGNTRALGYKHTFINREKMSKANLGKSVSIETRELIRQARLGKNHVLDTCKKISTALCKRWIVILPTGQQEHTTNLPEYCKKHSLNCGNMYRVASGYQKHHKGFKIMRGENK